MQRITEVPKLPERKFDAHKGDFGKICIIGGSIGFSGAPALAGSAALRSGAGLVRIATPKSVLPIVASIDPCYTTIPLPEDKQGRIATTAITTVLKHLEQNNVIAFGPGVGISRGVKNVLEALIAQQNIRLIIDADGLNCLAKSPGWTERKKASIILTPHPGEMKRLWNPLIRDQLPNDRTTQAAMLSERTGCIAILKGAGTVVADKDRIYVNTSGNPGMATAGSGDVLTGIIAALAGQGLDDFDAAITGVYVHGLAADIAAEKTGMVSLTAADIINTLPKAFSRL